jgi:hypothetical protein
MGQCLHTVQGLVFYPAAQYLNHRTTFKPQFKCTPVKDSVSTEI